MQKSKIFTKKLKLSFKQHATLWLLGLSLVSCSEPQPYPDRPLAQQILRPRPGFKGLTNRRCVEFDGDTCKRAETKDYDLNDPETRRRLNELEFVCYVNKTRYKVCKEKPGLCRFSYEKKCFLIFCGKPDKNVEYIDIGEYQKLLDGNTECFGRLEYPELEGR